VELRGQGGLAVRLVPAVPAAVDQMDPVAQAAPVAADLLDLVVQAARVKVS
jgi:hypothetical protein